MKTAFVLALFCLSVAGLPRAVQAAQHSTVRECDQVFTTYPYSDPDPIPKMSRFYPYFRFDGFTDTPVQKRWKVVELSNDYLRVLILPEVGGKIWAAIEKSTGRSFIYFNHVVKFRDVSMRGPWTSGGMEPNFGIMGHTPNCFSPVDYLTRRNPDGSASCFIGVLDLLTRSWWRLEINLPGGAACFTTRSFWHNASSLDEPYYTWMNVGIKAAGNLEFINPGTHYLGHDGRVFDWPVNPENGRRISWYEQNNFGSYKSYHVFGWPSEFFGGYWHDEDFGMARCSAFGDKPGRKIWIWGLSREGMIWQNLLTDTDGQYVEVQSGRLFNQADDSSSRTPFKHREFAAHATDTWTEYWEPVKGTKGFVSASPWGALNVTRDANRLLLRISPTRKMRGRLEVLDADQPLWHEEIDLRPMQPVEKNVTLPVSPRRLKVTLGGDKLVYVAEPDDPSTRPFTSPPSFDWNSTYGRFLRGKEDERQREYPKAEEAFKACLRTEPEFAPALVEVAALANRRGDYTRALEYSRRALSIDTYDPAANYQFALSNAALHHHTDARDGFSIAALSIERRSAADTELAKEFLRERNLERALSSAEESLKYNSLNADALQLEAIIYRLQGRKDGAAKILSRLLEIDPLNHFARFEKYLTTRGGREEVTGLIRNELPQETYLELAIWYHDASLDQDAARLLELAPPTAEVLYWLAYLRRAPELLKQAEAASCEFVFPFRRESIPVFEWADQQRPAWQPKYFLALIRWSQGELERAEALLVACGDVPQFAPFYATRAQVTGATSDLETAHRMDPKQWRYSAMLMREHLNKGDSAAALSLATEVATRFPDNGVIAVLRAKALVAAREYRPAAELLDSLNLLPCEGSTEAHSLFRESHLALGADSLKTSDYATALAQVRSARQWPERLGSGKPYAADLDERLDDWLEYRCLLKLRRNDEAQAALKRVLNSNSHRNGVGAIAEALALERSGRRAEADRMLEGWVKEQPGNELPKWGLELLTVGNPPPRGGGQYAEVNALAASLR